MMSATTHDIDSNDIWYVDLGASNHMTHYKNWFNEMQVPEKPSYVETSDDIMHTIEHVGKVPLCIYDGKTNHMDNVFYVPN